MIRSMTGFGRYESCNEDFKITVEIKTVNHRYCDIYIKMPRQISFFEDKIRNLISDKISRGKTDVYISYENHSESRNEVRLDIGLAKAYHEVLKTISEKLNVRDDVSALSISRFPDVLRVEKKDDEESLWAIMKDTVKIACEKLVEMRETEGEKLKESLLEIADRIDSYTNQVKKRAPLVVLEYKEKLNNRLTDLMDNKVVDETRLAMEVAIFADKCSVDEEMVRLNSHTNQLRKILEMNEPVGRKLDFLIQEMNREVNTIGSKANDLEITKTVVELKSEIEKLREQVQNIE